MATKLKDIAPEKIKSNPENPRMHFRDTGLNRLADSIEESGGVLVPVYVYPDPDESGVYRLVDGERRWRMALRLGLDTIPALVRDGPPDPAQNIVEMFNIHKVREDWEEMPTARALQEVMRRKDTEDPDVLKQLTGLSKEQIARYRLTLDLPKRYQQLIEDGKVPMNFFWELDRNVIRPLEKSRTKLAKEYTAAKLRQAFLSKRDSGALKDLIDLRKVKPIIDRAAMDAGAPDAPSSLDGFLKTLFKDKLTTIDEVYDASVSFAVESDKLTQQAQQLPASFALMLSKAGSSEERDSVLDQLRKTRDALTALVEEHDPRP
ncbi:MAG TPA: ParB/RepB/Spo0J family partition protein [Solirubrobacteraceae bacterium]|jgi:ParB/RepB/Spo0J family partition protein|nr:ParB/RepB/Spo0J family partition protein [Solirubrobacteraceae bacterium]